MLAGAHPASADALTFSGGTLVETVSNPNPYYVWTYTEGGMQVTLDETYPSPDFLDFNFAGNTIPGIEIGLNSLTEFSLVDGGPFALDSFDFSGGGDTIMYAYLDGNLLPNGIILTGSEAFVQPGPEWSDITSVVWCAQCLSGFDPNNTIGDLVYTEIPVGTPEPATLTMFGTALLSMLSWRRRRRAHSFQRFHEPGGAKKPAECRL